jgi:hypothetical protein
MSAKVEGVKMNLEVIVVVAPVVFYFGGLAIVIWKSRKRKSLDNPGGEASSTMVNKPSNPKPRKEGGKNV